MANWKEIIKINKEENNTTNSSKILLLAKDSGFEVCSLFVEKAGYLVLEKCY